jgi:hypothetical protein
VITSSKTSSAPLASQSARSAWRNPGAGGDDAHVPRDRLDEDRRESLAVPRHGSRDGVDVVVGQHDRVGCDAGGHAGRRRDTERHHARACARKQRVDVPEVVTGELDHAVATGRRAGQPDSAHRRLGPGRDEPHHLDRGDGVDDLRGELDLALGRRAEASCRARRLATASSVSGRRGRRAAAPTTCTQST